VRCFRDSQSGVVLHDPGNVAAAARSVFVQELRRAFLMRKYHSVCPGCGRSIERAYGEMGEGLLYEDGCQCRVELALGDWAAIGLVLLACLVLAVG